MKFFIYKLSFTILSILSNSVNAIERFPNYGSDNIARTWEPVNNKHTVHGVHERILDFLYDNNVTNCYEHQEDLNHLLLKCWSYEDLVDVSILIRRNNFLPILNDHPSTEIAVC